jgi:hypothetical protein
MGQFQLPLLPHMWIRAPPGPFRHFWVCSPLPFRAGFFAQKLASSPLCATVANDVDWLMAKQVPISTVRGVMNVHGLGYA